MHARGSLLDFAGGQLLEVGDAGLEPFHALLLASVGSRNLLLVHVVIVVSVIGSWRMTTCRRLIVRLPLT